MTLTLPGPIDRTAQAAAWAAVDAAAARLKQTRIADLFNADRIARFTISAPHLTLDLTRERLDAGALAALEGLNDAMQVKDWFAAMAAGAAVNMTEARAAQHMTLRPSTAAQAAERAFADTFRNGALHGATGARLRHIVHLGIGGSDLGPRLLLDALQTWRAPGVQVRFAANIDGADISDALAGLEPRETLVIVVSKTFTTQETMANAAAARAWLVAGVGEAGLGAHLAAVSAAPQIAQAWGVAADRVFGFAETIGGRYSLWSAVSLSVRCALVAGALEGLAAGAGAMDRHTLETPFSANAPLSSAAAHLFNRVGLDAASYACIPYARRLSLLPFFLQQLEMESNGKRVDREGQQINRPAAGVTWGEVGANAQHSFFQLLHQGKDPVPVEFLLCARGAPEPPGQQALLNANLLAQAEALLVGKTQAQAEAELIAAGHSQADAARLSPHKTFPGDRPSTVIGLEALTPESLGALLAFYEHRTIAQAWMMGVNPFDQWGVELGKALAKTVSVALAKGDTNGLHPATAAWVARLKDKA
jgi:glucose-6-phosphate isomerase